MTGAIAFVLYGPVFGLGFCVLVAVSLWAAMAVAAIVGSVGPLVLEKIRIDPATAVGPMVTTITDLLGISIYFSLAVWMVIGKS